MTSIPLLVCSILLLTSAYAAAANCAASVYCIELRLRSGAALAILVVGSVIGCVAVSTQGQFPAEAAMLVAFSGVVTCAACDAACGYVFDAVSLPCLAATSVLALLSEHFAAWGFGVLATGGSLFALYALTRGRGLGFGDVKLACCIGAAVGALGGVEALGIAFVLGGVYAAFLLVTKRAQMGSEMRFAPYLAAGMALVSIHGVVL